MQLAKDAYRADHAVNGGHRAINVPGAMGMGIMSMPSKMVKAVLAGNVNLKKPSS